MLVIGDDDDAVPNSFLEVNRKDSSSNIMKFTSETCKSLTALTSKKKTLEILDTIFELFSF